MSEEYHEMLIGQHYIEAERQRVTPVDYNGRTYQVRENLWTNENGNDEWCVTLSLADRDFSKSTDKANIHNWLQIKMDEVAVLSGLEYEVYDCDDGTIFWRKSAESSTHDSSTNQN